MSLLAWPLGIMGVLYLVGLFPFAYFRHDDWVIIGNSAFINEDWAHLLKPTLYYGREEAVWFFRPFFKLNTYFFYHLFGLNYYPWLVAQLLMVLGTLWILRSLALKISKNELKSNLLVCLFAVSFHLHLGSILWAGEGLMNCPQALLLALNLYFFYLGSIENRTFAKFVALIAFVLSLGFKEASFFHVFFLTAMVLVEKPWQNLNWRKKLLLLSPYTVIAGIYLILRLGFVPLSPSYKPMAHFPFVYTPILQVTGALLLPTLALILGFFIVSRTSLSAWFSNLKKYWLYLPYFGISIAPYIGQGFFSPGWLTLPGLFFVFALSLSLPDIEEVRIGRIAWLTTALIAIPLTLGAMTRDHWWSWAQGQREISSAIASLDANQVKEIIVSDCTTETEPRMSYRRVLGGEWTLSLLWYLHHRVHPTLWIDSTCQRAIFPQPTTSIVLSWRFPHLSRQM